MSSLPRGCPDEVCHGRLTAAFFAVEAVVPDQRAAASTMLDGAGSAVAMVIIAAGAAIGAYRLLRGLVLRRYGTVVRGLGRLLATAAVVALAGALLGGWAATWRSITTLL